MIIPAKFVPQELENCGKAGIKAAIILSSGLPRRGARPGRSCSGKCRRSRRSTTWR
jgi:hypothetical protein